MTSITKVKILGDSSKLRSFCLSPSLKPRVLFSSSFLLFYESINSKLVPYLNTNLDINVARTESGYIFVNFGPI